MSSLVPENSSYQMHFLINEEQRERQRQADLAADGLRRRFGYQTIRRGIVLCDGYLTGEDPVIREVHPHSYMERGNRVLEG